MAYIELNVLNNANPSEPILGIDLGTTNSLAALWRDGRPQALAPEGESAMVPSAIYFPPEGEPLVGRAARERALTDPRNAIFSFKRLMGRSLAECQDDLRNVSFPATENERKVVQLEVHGRKYTPQELSALVLMKVHDQACRALGGHAPQRAVITVPAYFDDAQRQATRDAARIAGVDAVRIVNEPTAASLAYGLDQRKQGRVAVYDLGGGTFDVSILSIEDGVFRVLATAGDTHLGGDDFDAALVKLALEDLAGRMPHGALASPAMRQSLRLISERAKIELSRAPQTTLHLVVPELELQWRRELALSEFEALIEPIVARTLEACRRALADAKLTAAEIDEVVLVGGSTRVPLVQRTVQQFFGRKPHAELNPDEVVALGAAVQGHVLAGGTRDILLMDVTPLSLGLETMGGAMAKIIARNSPIPCHATEGFTTYADNQTGIDFNILQGERELAKDCRSLGRFKLKGIPPMAAGMARVAVRFHLDADGVLNVTAKEESTGTAAHIDVQPMSGLTDGEVESMLDASFKHAREDFDARRRADLKVELATNVRHTEKRLPEVRAALDRESVLDIEEALAAARKAQESEDTSVVQRARDELDRASMPLAALLMDQVAKQALQGKGLSDFK